MRLRNTGTLAVVVLLAALAPAGAATASDDPEEHELEGVIQSLPGTPGFMGDWTVSGTTVHVNAATEIDDEDGDVVLGATVEVDGHVEADGSITASTIEVEDETDNNDDDGDNNDDDGDNNDNDDGNDDDFGEFEFDGFIEALPATTGFVGDWTVSGMTVHVTADTEIDQEDGPVAIGAAVEVEGVGEADGSVTATDIEVKDADDVDDDDDLCLTGTATRLPRGDHSGTWRVSKHDVRVRPGTTIVHETRLSHGSTVRVFGTLRANGSIRASKIVVRN